MDSYARPPELLSRRRADSFERIKASARKLFIERGYHATRSQDIAREAGLGHGTFYLHFEDKRVCFLSFMEDARAEFLGFMRTYIGHPGCVDEAVERTVEAVYIFSDEHPGLLKAAMADEALIDAGDLHCRSLVQRWGRDWVQILREAGREDRAPDYEPNIVGQAILGAIRQGQLEGDRMGTPRAEVMHNLRLFITRALAP